MCGVNCCLSEFPFVSDFVYKQHRDDKKNH